MSLGKSPLSFKPDYLVCTCMGVMHSDIVQAIQEGAVDFDAISEKLMVGTGCNSCVDEVLEIIKEQQV